MRLGEYERTEALLAKKEPEGEKSVSELSKC